LWALDRETFNNIVKRAAMEKREKYEGFLKSVNIFNSMEPYEVSQICDALKVVRVEADQYIIKEKEEGDIFYIIEEGEAIAEKTNSKTGQLVNVKTYSKGDFFGELALIRNEPRAASIRTTTDCKLLTLDRMSFKRLLGPIETILKRNSDNYIKFTQVTTNK
jgi:cAMP-dependent protein kinase regulator